MRVSKREKRFFGVGVEWTDSIQEGLLEHIDKIALVELIPENFFNGRRFPFLRALGKTGIPVMIHGVELSLGTEEPLKISHLEEMLRVADEVNVANFSDHICMTDAGGVEIGQLTPLPWTIETCDTLCRKIDQVQRRLKVPLMMENIANRFVFPASKMSEVAFINLMLKRTGCGLLLDLHNIHVNGINFNFNPFEWLGEIDLDAVTGIHLAGGHLDEDGMLMDSHSALAPPRVWDLYRYVCERIHPACTIVEWTDATPPYKTILGEVERAQKILNTRVNVPSYAEQRAQGGAA
jgi:uncharacterized protein (UPF0276 family)